VPVECGPADMSMKVQREGGGTNWFPVGRQATGGNSHRSDGSLVDPASSHMLVSKIKPCMSQCKPH
jgi:hypothetical protein